MAKSVKTTVTVLEVTKLGGFDKKEGGRYCSIVATEGGGDKFFSEALFPSKYKDELESGEIQLPKTFMANKLDSNYSESGIIFFLKKELSNSSNSSSSAASSKSGTDITRSGYEEKNILDMYESVRKLVFGMVSFNRDKGFTAADIQAANDLILKITAKNVTGLGIAPIESSPLKSDSTVKSEEPKEQPKKVAPKKPEKTEDPIDVDDLPF